MAAALEQGVVPHEGAKYGNESAIVHIHYEELLRDAGFCSRRCRTFLDYGARSIGVLLLVSDFLFAVATDRN